MAAKNAKTVKKADSEREEGMSREITGVCLIALGLFLGAGIYTDMVGVVGEAVKDLCFGLFGMGGYAAPIILAVLGVLAIALSKSSSGVSALWTIFAGIVCLLVIIHTAGRGTIAGLDAPAYYADAYLYGRLYLKGGGFVGALLAYPAMLLFGNVGTYILFGAAIIIVFLAATRLSIRAVGQKVGRSIRNGLETVTEKIHEVKPGEPNPDELFGFEGLEQVYPVKKPAPGKRPLYTETLSQEDRQPLASKPDQGASKDGGHSERRREGSKLRREKNEWSEDISFLPSNGALPRRRDDDDPFDILSEVDESQLKAASPAEPAEEGPSPFPADEGEGEEKTEEIKIPEPPVYVTPPISRLKKPSPIPFKNTESPAAKGKKLEEALASFNIQAVVTNYSVGPVITRFELRPARGVRVNRITSLSDDIALALAAPRVRIEAPIPGKSAVGIEIPNKNTKPVLLREVIESPEFTQGNSALRFGLGKDIAGNVICADLDRMPHMLIAGSTGSGKSVCINDIILSFVYGKKPEDVRLILIDPKQVEFRVYSPMPHLLMPVVTDPKKAARALKWAVMEMEQRYKKMAEYNARSITRYNSLQDGAGEKLPRLVIIIDELADLMMVAAKEVEESICRIAQLGRAAGIHLIVATQRPSTDIITGLIKANIPSRIALAVSSAVDSRVILDTGGAERLLGRGDMLFHADGSNKPVRAQCAFVSDEEVESVMDFFSVQQDNEGAKYEEVSIEEVCASVETATARGNGKQEDDLLDDAVKIVLESGQASISMIQRRLRVGYARAARLIDIMEQKNIVSGFDGSKPRKLLIGSFAEYLQLAGENDTAEE